MTKQITITILAEDILKNSYYDYEHCPITRALHRAGYKKAYDHGGIGGIINGENVDISSFRNKDYNDMLDKVLAMYRTKGGFDEVSDIAIPIEDFTVTINY